VRKILESRVHADFSKSIHFRRDLWYYCISACSARYWDVSRADECVRVYRGHARPVLAVCTLTHESAPSAIDAAASNSASTASDACFATADQDGAIMIWDPRLPHAATPALETRAVSCDAGTGAALACPSLGVTALAWTGAVASTPSLLVAGSEDGTLSWFDLRAPAAALGAHKLHADAIRSIGIRARTSSAELTIATASDDQRARVSRLDAAARDLTVELRVASTWFSFSHIIFP
jgi:WD40 repeat protein